MRCCKVCGKENPDNVDFCTSCGGTLFSPVEPKPSELAEETLFERYFRESWRQFVRSPLPLLFVLCYSVCVLLKWFNQEATFQEVEKIVHSMGGWSLSLLSYRNIILTVVHIIEMLPGTLMALGMWAIYADAWDKTDRPIRLGALKFIAILQVANFVVICLVFGFAILISGRALLLVVVLAGLILTMYWLMTATALSVRNVVQNYTPDSRYIKALAIVEFILAGLNVLSVVSGNASNGLGGFLNGVLSFLLGSVLLQYKEFMDKINCKYVETETETGPVTIEQEQIPAWKRVQMEKENSEE